MRSKLLQTSWLLFAVAVAAAPTTAPTSLAGESHQIANVTQQDDRLRPRDASNKEGNAIVLYPHEDWKCMTWKFEPAGDDVRLINYFTHKTLFPVGADTSAVTQHVAAKEPAAAEHWRFISAGDNTYRIQHVSTGRVLSITPTGEVIVEPWTDASSQKWKLLDKPAHFTG